MIFNTWVYALFLAVSVCLNWLAPPRWRPLLLIVLGLVFYCYAYPIHLVFVIAATLLVFAVARALRPGAVRQPRLWLAVGVGLCLGALGYFKYRGWAMGLAGATEWFTPPDLHPPLGISFFTFEYVHYLVEVYRGTFAPASLRDFFLFIMFFPSLICGPIKRFQQFNPQEYAQARLDPSNLNLGLERILVGLAKKTLVADQVAPYCAGVFAHPESFAWGQLWLAVYGYALQIYFDFSGYSDIAIGSARLLGYTVPENFNYPYLQPNIARFWRSWHMSLTSWITDYLYIPLGGSRRGEWRSYGNRLAAMTLCGLWHGAAFHFAVWGLYHGVALNLYRLYQRVRGTRDGSGPLVLRVLSTVLTFHVVSLGWVLFVCDLPQAGAIMARLLLLRS